MADAQRATLTTFGHGTLGRDELATLIRNAGIEQVIDVRSVPKSRRLPHVWREQMEQWVPELAGAAYRWVSELGGFRRPKSDSANLGLEHPSFRGYADYMETDVFIQALGGLLAEAALRKTAIMCSESVWWRCHRRLIADAAVLLRGAFVQHLMHDGKLAAHRLTEGVHVTPAGRLNYGEPRLPLAVTDDEADVSRDT
jgi:uncharacterized protein (DUF488 family)